VKKALAVLLTFGLFLVQAFPCSAAFLKVSAEALQRFSMPVPPDPSHKAYLGLSGNRPDFTIPDIVAEVVIIEIFSMYCPHCQREAPEVNALYRAIEDSPQLKGKIKVLGIGAANTPYEVDLFKKTYSIPFPLISDEELKIREWLEGEVGTPFFIGVRIREDRTLDVFLSHLGRMAGSQQFLKRVIKESGLK
jgi:thiol-disulfide isomerase/thioredoxin